MTDRRSVIFFGTPEVATWLPALAPAACYAGWESHCVVALPTNSHGYPAVVATGTGKRGAAFGAYTFSEAVLGVNPWYIINDDPPTYKGPSIVIADTFSTVVPPPFYKCERARPLDLVLATTVWPPSLIAVRRRASSRVAGAS